MQPTARLEVVEVDRGAPVAGCVAAWGALTAGLGPLAADRAGRGIERAVAEAIAPVTLMAHVEPNAVSFELHGGGGGWAARAARLLSGLGSCTVHDHGVEVRLVAPPLRRAPAD